jgi:2-methylcitrate dehydratase PrpD
MIASSDEASQTRRLADFAAGLRRDTLPDPVVHAAKRALVDWIAAVLAGCQEPAAAKVHSVIRAVAPEPVARVVGTDLMTSAPFAALANGYASHLQDYDDVFNPVQTTIHLGSCIWPVVLAFGGSRRVSGWDAITGHVAGFETGARVGIAAGITHFESSWQVSGTAGRLAAAAACARVLELPGDLTTNALGIAAAQASGIREIYGTDTKALQPGKAAMDGVLAGLLAEAGLSSRDTAIEGPRGLLSAISTLPDPTMLTEGLNETWHVLYNGHKLYACASLLHPAIDAIVELRRSDATRTDDIASIEVHMLPFAAGVTSEQDPAPGAAAKFSAAHCVAVAMQYGRLPISSFDAAMVDDPAVARLRPRVYVIADPDVGKRGATVIMTMRDGRTRRSVVENNRGTPESRLSDGELEAKLMDVGQPRFSRAALTRVVNACWDLDFVDDINEVIAPLSPRQ